MKGEGVASDPASGQEGCRTVRWGAALRCKTGVKQLNTGYDALYISALVLNCPVRQFRG